MKEGVKRKKKEGERDTRREVGWDGVERGGVGGGGGGWDGVRGKNLGSESEGLWMER